MAVVLMRQIPCRLPSMQDANWRKNGCVVAISGEADTIIDATRTVLVHTNGIGLTRITGGGCALGAFNAGMLAVHGDPL